MACFAQKEAENEPEDAVHRVWGTFGRYQIIINFILAFIYIPVNWQMLSMNFLAAETDFWCKNSTGEVKKSCSANCTLFEHDKSFWQETIRQKWDLVCENDNWYGYINSIFMSGVGVGVVFGGLASDRWGRKPVLFFLVGLQSFAAFSRPLSTHSPFGWP